MSDITDVNALPEQLPGGEVDWDAPESGSFPPAVFPGTYPFVFSLPDSQDDQFTVVEIQKQAHLQVNFIARIPVNEIKEEQFTMGQPDGETVDITFQRANTFKSEKMKNSFLGELLRSLEVKVQPFTKQGLMDALRAADGKVRGLGEIGWRAYCKNCDHTISTQPRKKKGDTPWPRTADGKFALVANCPNCGTGYYGREEIMRYRLPQAQG